MGYNKNMTKFLWPVDKPFRWISGYHYTPPSHNGLDYGTQMGANYYAPQAGTVIISTFPLPPNTTGQKYGYGNYIKIDHGNGWTTLGAHLLEGYVEVGDVVEAGQLIALTDNTGWSSGSHLHFEIRRNNVPVNPADYLVDVLDPNEPPDEPPVIPDPIIPILPIAIVNVYVGSTLNIRYYPKTANSRVVGSLKRGDEVEVMKIIMENENKWLQIGRNQHICMQLGNDQLCVWKESEAPTPTGVDGSPTLDSGIFEILD